MLNSPLERISLEGSLELFLHRVCRVYGLSHLQTHTVITAGYEDCNIILQTTQGKFLAKIFAKTREDFEVTRYVEIIRRAVAAGVRHPRILEMVEGGNLFEGHGVKLVVLEFVEGKTFYELGRPLTDDELEAVVAEAAKINQIDYSPPYLFDSWAIPNVEKMYEKVREFLSPDDLALADAALARFRGIPLDKLPRAFVHGDLIQTNVLKGDDGNVYVLDFSVANTYPRIQELAMIASSLLTGMSLRQKCQKLIEMYSKHNPLTNTELEHLHDYALAASAMELLGGHQEKYINGIDNEETGHWISTGREGLKEASL